MTDYNKLREFLRVDTKFNVTMEIEGQTIQCGRTRDLSMKGLLVLCEERYPVGTNCRISIHLGGPDSGPKVDARGTIVREHPDGLGIQFFELDVDSYNHLKNMIIHNAEETEKAEQEIHDHVGLKHRNENAS